MITGFKNIELESIPFEPGRKGPARIQIQLKTYVTCNRKI